MPTTLSSLQYSVQGITDKGVSAHRTPWTLQSFHGPMQIQLANAMLSYIYAEIFEGSLYVKNFADTGSIREKSSIADI